MRPRKVVLIVSGDPYEAGILRFVLDVYCYRAKVTRYAGLRRIATVDCVVAMEGADQFAYLEDHADHMRTVFLTSRYSISHVLERVRVACARRRGPKPGYKAGTKQMKVAA